MSALTGVFKANPDPITTPSIPTTATRSAVDLSGSVEASAASPKKEEPPRINAVPVVALDYYTAFRNNQIIKILNRIEADSKNVDDTPNYPSVAQIRGRQLFVIRPSTWRGLAFFQQIWWIFNRIICRYQAVDPESITAVPLYQQTKTTIASPLYKDWLGISALENQVKMTQKALDAEKETNGKLAQELAGLKTPKDSEEDPKQLRNLISKLKDDIFQLTTSNRSKETLIADMREIPNPGTQLEYQTIIDQLITLINSERTYLNRVSRILEDVEKAKTVFNKNADGLLKQLADDFHERKKEDQTASIQKLLKGITSKIGEWLPKVPAQFVETGSSAP